MEMDLIGGPLEAYLACCKRFEERVLMNYASITIRQSTVFDRGAIERVAALDSGRVPEGRSLVALENGEVRAVLPMDGSRPLADPFHHTAELVELMRAASPPSRRRRFALLRPFAPALNRTATLGA
jgi:hypothetical protein